MPLCYLMGSFRETSSIPVTYSHLGKYHSTIAKCWPLAKSETIAFVSILLDKIFTHLALVGILVDVDGLVVVFVNAVFLLKIGAVVLAVDMLILVSERLSGTCNCCICIHSPCHYH